MARADLLKKLFSSYVYKNNEMFTKVANEIIEDERKKNHGILANDLKMILNGGTSYQKPFTTLAMTTPKDNDRDIPLVEIIYPEKYFCDLIISSDIETQLEQIIKEFNNWDILVSNGVYPTRKVLLYGPPGCGKTLTAQSLASELGIPMLYVRFDAVVSSYLGETASNIKKVFDYARDESWVIFFDEFDAIGRSRGDNSEHGEIKRVVNAFLQQIDNYKGKSLIIAATNFERSLDYALWRRFDETICFSMPSQEEKMRLLELKLSRFKGPFHVFNELINNVELFAHSDIEKVADIIIKQCILEGRRVYSKKDIKFAMEKQKRIVALRKTQY